MQVFALQFFKRAPLSLIKPTKVVSLISIVHLGLAGHKCPELFACIQKISFRYSVLTANFSSVGFQFSTGERPN